MATTPGPLMTAGPQRTTDEAAQVDRDRGRSTRVRSGEMERCTKGSDVLARRVKLYRFDWLVEALGKLFNLGDLFFKKWLVSVSVMD